jgi:hypothetical protein
VSPTEKEVARSLFLDTTIHVDLVVEDQESRADGLKRLTQGSDYRISCAFARLEYKRVVLQNWSLSLDYLCDAGTYSGALDRANRLRRQRRVNTLVKIFAWIHRRAASGTIETPSDATIDSIVADRSISILRVAIRSGWARFNRHVDSLVDAMNCQRALEAPRAKKNGGLDVTVHQLQCRNRRCDNANFFRRHRPSLLRLRDHIRQLPSDLQRDELTAAAEAIRLASTNADRLYDYGHCLEIGDVWHHIECVQSGVKDFATTNYHDSQVLCPALGLKMRVPDGYPRGES